MISDRSASSSSVVIVDKPSMHTKSVDSTDDDGVLLHAFDRLAITKGLKQGSQDYSRQQGVFYADKFEGLYGKTSKLSGLHMICEDLGISPLPSSVNQCRKALSKIRVNIIDLVNARLHRDVRKAAGEEVEQKLDVKTFKSIAALRKYTIVSKKFYPLKRAKADATVKPLLIQM